MMRLFLSTSTLITFFGITLAIATPTVRAHVSETNFIQSNPPAEIPSPSLYKLDRHGAINPADPLRHYLSAYEFRGR